MAWAERIRAVKLAEAAALLEEVRAAVTSGAADEVTPDGKTMSYWVERCYTGLCGVAQASWWIDRREMSGARILKERVTNTLAKIAAKVAAQ